MKKFLIVILGSFVLTGFLISIASLANSYYLYNNLRKIVTSDLNYLDDRIYEIEKLLVEQSVKNTTPKYDEYIKVKRVIDGDTIELENGERLRYIGIDTPELYDPRKPVQCFAEEASQKNKELVEGKLIKFYKDVSERDKYQRLLGYVYLEDGTFVNLEMVKQGYAFSYSYPPDISKQDEFLQAEKEAREKNLGLWSNCTITTNSSGREETNPI